MKYLDSVVFPYGLCQSGDYIVVANGTALIRIKCLLEFAFYDLALYAAPAGRIDWMRRQT